MEKVDVIIDGQHQRVSPGMAKLLVWSFGSNLNDMEEYWFLREMDEMMRKINWYRKNR